MTTTFLSKSVFQLRSHLVSNTAFQKSRFQFWAENALRKTRQLLRVFYGRKGKLSSEIFRDQHRLPVEYFQSGCGRKSKFIFYRPGFLNNVTSKWVADSIAGAVSKETRKKLQQRCVGLCFVGLALAKKPSLLTDEEELEEISYLIRDSFSTIPWQSSGLNIDKNYGNQKAFVLEDLKFGDFIAKGCNASIYSACFQWDDSGITSCKSANESEKLEVNKTDNQDLEAEGSSKNIIQGERCDDLSMTPKLIISHSEGEQNLMQNDMLIKPSAKKDTQFPVGGFGAYKFAVKIMFNYSAESNAFAIWSAMQKETLPSIMEFPLGAFGEHKVRKKRLKPHPNVVEMYFAFADQLPLLPGAYDNYPQALPERLLNDGCGRNMTLFLVMKRYHCNLKDYLKNYRNPTNCTKISLLLFTQLMEALVHLYQNGIAHRDLKTDNLLIDLSQGVSSPKLVVTDFGCCLEGLSLKYSSFDVNKGGNMALMAPEVWNAEIGTVIDYSRSDLWTAGTIAYEIFGGSNPFYSTTSSLKSNSYEGKDLPSLPAQTPPVIQRLVREMLRVKPTQRPRPSFVATVCQILLHATTDLLHSGCSEEVCKRSLTWICQVFASTYLESTVGRSHPSLLEFELRHTFCSRIQYLEVAEALKYILEDST